MSQPGHTAARFDTTHWSMVAAAARQNAAQGGQALEELCRAYWAPLYAFARHSGLPPAAAKDVTQETFATLLDGSGLERADPDRGRFRSYLLTCLKNVMNTEWRKAHTAKRGGRTVTVDLDALEDGLPELCDSDSPDRLYDRAWARALLDRVLGRLRAEAEASGHAARFAVLQTYVADLKGTLSMQAACEQLGLSMSAVKGAIHRLRQRYVALVREEVAVTVETPEDVDEEVRALFVALGT